MKAVGGVVAFSAVGIVLQGCGGGDAPVKVNCFNNQMNLVSQSIEATSVTKMHQGVVFERTTTGTSTAKMDVNNFNVFFEVDGATVTTLGDQENDYTSWQRMAINADKQEAVMWTKITLATTKVTMNNCTIMPVPFPKEKLKQMYSVYLGMLQKNMTCTGNDGTFDTFHGELDVSATHHKNGQTAMPPSKWSADIQMDKDYLMGGTSTVTANFKGESEMGMEYTETTTKVVAGGPSSDALDWSKWGVECKNANASATTPGALHASSVVKFALDAKKFNPGAIHFFSQVLNIDTPVLAHENSKVVVV